MSQTVVSVVVPVYNRVGMVGECVRAALGQSWGELEVVVVDNCSTDGTWAVCEGLARGDSRVRVFRNESNVGPVRNWMRGVREARGEIGKILFSDDLIAPSFLEKTLPFLEDPEIGLVTAAAEISGRVEYLWRPGKVSSRQYLWDSMFDGRLPVSPGAALFRMRDLRKHLHDFGSHGIGPDLLLMMLTANSYPYVAHVAEPLAVFRDHAGSISHQRRSELSRGYALARMRFVLSLARLMHT